MNYKKIPILFPFVMAITFFAIYTDSTKVNAQENQKNARQNKYYYTKNNVGLKKSFFQVIRNSIINGNYLIQINKDSIISLLENGYNIKVLCKDDKNLTYDMAKEIVNMMNAINLYYVAAANGQYSETQRYGQMLFTSGMQLRNRYVGSCLTIADFRILLKQYIIEYKGVVSSTLKNKADRIFSERNSRLQREEEEASQKTKQLFEMLRNKPDVIPLQASIDTRLPERWNESQLAKEYNKYLSNIKAFKNVDKGYLLLKFTYKSIGCYICKFLIRLFDKNGVEITHFVTEQHYNLFEHDYGGPKSKEIVPDPVVLAYNVNVRDLRDVQFVEFGFLPD